MGDPPAGNELAELYATHARGLHRYLAGRVGAEIADDLVADAFLAFWERRNRYDPSRASAKTWLYGIATNLLRNHVRTEERRLRAWRRDGMRPLGADDLGGRVAEAVDANVLAEKLSEALAALKPADHDVLLLTAWADLTPTEIATVLGMSASTVRVRLHRTRTRLGTHLRTQEGRRTDA